MLLTLYILTLLLKTLSHGRPLTKVLHTIASALGEFIRNPKCPETPEWSLYASAVPNSAFTECWAGQNVYTKTKALHCGFSES